MSFLHLNLMTNEIFRSTDLLKSSEGLVCLISFLKSSYRYKSITCAYRLNLSFILTNEYFSILIYECPRHTGFLGGVVYIRWATQKPAHPPAPPPHPYFLPCFTLFYFLPCFTLFLHLPYITAFYFLPYIFTGGFLLGGVTGDKHHIYSFYPVFYCFTWCLLVLFYATNFLLFTLYYRDF
mgnify:CR=1 FL=1